MLLFFLRHGDVAELAYDDASRVLSEKGEEQARIAAEALRAMGVSIELIISSPLSRAKQTAEIVQAALKVQERRISEYLVPDSNPRQMLTELQLVKQQSVLLVGHEPQLRSFSSLLLTGELRMDILFKKGSMSCLSVPQPLAYGKGALLWHITNEQMSLFFR